MSDPTILTDTPSVISSPGSAAGAVPSILRCGRTNDLFGQDPAPASPSAARGSRKAAQTIATSGPPGSVSSASADLQQFMENRLHQLFPTDGSIVCTLTWSRKATPSQRPYCQLRASVRTTLDTDSGLWPTPLVGATSSASHGQISGRWRDAMSAAMWPSPKASDADKGVRSPQGALKEVIRADTPDLPAQVGALWTTPTASDGERCGLIIRRCRW